MYMQVYINKAVWRILKNNVLCDKSIKLEETKTSNK